MDFVDDFEEYVSRNSIYEGDIELGEPISHDMIKCEIYDCEKCNKLRAIRDEIHKPLEISSLVDDTTSLMNRALAEGWSVDVTMDELTKLKEFHDTVWFELKRAVFESLLKSIPYSSLGGVRYLKTLYFYEKFSEIVMKWKNLIGTVFPSEYQSDIPDYLCLHITSPDYVKWCDRGALLNCFKFLHDQKLVSTEAYKEWYREECRKKYETTIFQHIGGSSDVQSFVSSLQK